MSHASTAHFRSRDSAYPTFFCGTAHGTPPERDVDEAHCYKHCTPPEWGTDFFARGSLACRVWNNTNDPVRAWAARHGHSAPVVHGLQVLAFSAPGATLFPHYIGESFIAFTELSCKFLKEVHAGDTLYPALEIIDLVKVGDKGTVTTVVTIYNQRNELVLSGQHKYLLKS